MWIFKALASHPLHLQATSYKQNATAVLHWATTSLDCSVERVFGYIVHNRSLHADCRRSDYVMRFTLPAAFLSRTAVT